MEWQPIETAPKDGTKVLIVDDDGVVDVAAYLIGKRYGYWDTETFCCPTHWMPLPPPPNYEREGA
jgi:hypothetical protein